jgi:predicted alpha/beta hydrolase
MALQSGTHINPNAEPQLTQANLAAAVTSSATTWTVPPAWTGPNQGLVFVAPPSGMTLLLYRARMHASASGGHGEMAPVVLTGAVIGSGSSQLAASIDNALQYPSLSTSDLTTSAWTLLTGLTPGSSYNLQMYAQQGGFTGSLTITSTFVLAMPWMGR